MNAVGDAAPPKMLLLLSPPPHTHRAYLEGTHAACVAHDEILHVRGLQILHTCVGGEGGSSSWIAEYTMHCHASHATRHKSHVTHRNRLAVN
jgi:hypothetical protein